MSEHRAPTSEELPSNQQLLRSSMIALAVAVGIAVTVVLPAERGVDPTGVGRLIGLTQMGELKTALAAEPVVAEPASAARGEENASTLRPGPSADVSSEEVALTLQPGEAAELKLAMNEGARVQFDWRTDGPLVNFDTHGDAPGIDYHGYAKGKGVSGDSGVLIAAFNGHHGWYWRNRSDAPATITLRVAGDFSEIERVL
jgi:hypothetical protein